MNIIRVENEQELGTVAGALVMKKLRKAGLIANGSMGIFDGPGLADGRKNNQFVIGLATGSTPIGLYRELVRAYQNGAVSFGDVTAFNLDEYVGLSGGDPNSYQFFMNKHLFHHIDIKEHFIPNGLADCLEAECERYEKFILEKGGIDLQILGLGANGHIGFNEPGTSFMSKTHVVKLAEETRQANSRFFASLTEVPTLAITMGIGTILKSREIVLLASGEKKASALAQLLEGGISEEVPVSALKMHEKVTVIADRAALGV